MELDQESRIPMKMYDSRISVCLNEENNGLEIASVDFDMAQFKYGEIKRKVLNLDFGYIISKELEDPTQAFIELSVKGSY